MKTMKKFAALLLVVVMMAAMLVVPANAAGTGSITINNALDGVEYTLYKVMDLSHSGDAYSYTVNTNWAGFFAPITGDNNDGLEFVTIENGYVIGLEEGEAAAFAKAAEAYADANGITGTTIPAGGGTVKFEDLEDGYYVVGTDLVNQAAFGMTVAGADVSKTEKNALPTIGKVSTGVPAMGETIEYTITIAVEGTVNEDYVVTDTMAGGKLDLVETSVKVVADGTAWTKDKEYVFTYDDAAKKLVLTLEQDYLNALDTADKVIITYDAVVIGTGAITNSVELNVGGPGIGGGEDTVYTYDIPVLKYAGTNTDESLAGAKFQLTREVSGTTQYAKAEAAVSGVYTITGWTDNVADAATFESTDVEYSSPVYSFVISGLGAGSYKLTETEAPEGYNKLASAIDISIAENGDATTTIVADGATTTLSDDNGDGKLDSTTAGVLKVQNKAGTEFPSTGGVGTTIFYCLGGMLVLAAVVFLVSKKRMIED